MKSEVASPPRFWRTVRLLLNAARKRAAGRRTRQQQLLHNRAGNRSTSWNSLGVVFSVLLYAILNGTAALATNMAVESGQRLNAERQGKIVVSSEFLNQAERGEPNDFRYSLEAKNIAKEFGGSPDAIEQRLRQAALRHGTQDFINDQTVATGISGLLRGGRPAALFGSVLLVWWFLMLVFQGEGLELDLQRQRHPMWEWLFTHPVPSGAIFLTEMLSPIASNPVYWSAPLFVGVLYGFAYDFTLGALAFFLIGVPLSIAAACLGKALEIGVTLRCSPRSRGAMIGIMSWLGYSSMFLFIAAIFAIEKVAAMSAKFLGPFFVVPWPWLRLFVGGQADGSFSFASGLINCWLAIAIVTVGAVWFSVWGAQKGLSGNFSRADLGPSASRKGSSRFGKQPLYRKEFLWFVRDRSAIVQTILIPLTIAGFQVINLRHFLSAAQGAWNYLCGVAILFGTYFLWVLGPKSLASEGTALWITLTWPTGLESLLKAKAWLWSLISSGLVALILIYSAFQFPADSWKILLLGIGWFLFAKSMAEKSVTLVSVASSSGEVESAPKGRQWAVTLGMLTFSIGVLTQQWHVAVMGIVYSYITAAAMWQNFRARLPYLYDPWSEELPAAPTLMHAMIAISILVESGAVVTGLIILLLGSQNLALAQTLAYSLCALLVSFGTASFLANRDVSLSDVWFWKNDGAPADKLLPALLTGAGGGLLLGFLGRVYLALLAHLPPTSEMIRHSQEQVANSPEWRISLAVCAVLAAPYAEEYLFRGLLFRALDREWGGWHAVLGSAAFFAIYHPPLSWPPVALVGVVNALLFKKTRLLAPAVVLHAVYNAVVLI